MTPAASRSAPLSLRRKDPLHEAVDRLARALPARADARVVVDLLEDDLREGLEALGDVESHFTEVVELLRSGSLTPVSLLDAGEEARVLQRLEVLFRVVTQLRRRMGQAAGMMRRG